MGAKVREQVERWLADLRHAQRQVADEQAALAQAKTRVTTARQAQELINEAAQAVQESAHQQIASIVTRCLRAVFGSATYEFCITFTRCRGKTEARLGFVQAGCELEPTDAVGGGVLDTAAFALRLACLVLAHPARRRLLVLDEPFRFASKEYRPRIRELVLTLAQELGIQMLIVTHDPVFEMGKVVRIE